MGARAIWVGTVVTALLVVLTAREVAAQGGVGAQRLFAGASVAWNIDNSVWSDSGSESSGGALAIGLAFGLTFADRWSMQVEGEFPTADGTAVSEYTYPSGYPYRNQIYTSVTRTTYRTPTVAVLFGVHGRPSKRVDLAFQFGPALRNEKQSRESQTVVDGTVIESYRDSWSDWSLGISVGGEVAVGVTPRVAVVGQLRVHLERLYLDDLSHGTVVRPAIGVRVRF